MGSFLWRRGLVSVTCALTFGALALSACSSGTTGGTPADSGPPLTGSTIKIGFMVGLTGRNTQGIPASKIAPGWAKWVNANGGIGGHQVEVVIRDSKTDPGTAQSVVKDLVENQKVVALVVSDTTAEASIEPYMTAQKVPVIGGYAVSTATWSKVPNWFTMSTTIPTFISMGAVAAKQAGGSSFGAASCQGSATCSAVGPLYKSAAEAQGMKYAGLVGIADDSASYIAQCLTLMQGGADSIVLSIPPDTGGRVATDCTQQGYKGLYVMSAGTFQQALFTGNSFKGTTFVGGLNGFPWWSSAAPVKTFRDVVAKYAPGVDYRSSSTTVIWAALELFRKAVGSPTGDVTAADVINDYTSLKGETLDGLLPKPVTYTAGQPAPAGTCFWLFKYQGGDTDPVSIHQGASGNGANGDLASTCMGS